MSINVWRTAVWMSAGLSVGLAVCAGLWAETATATAAEFQVELTTAHRGFDGKSCWVHARAGVLPVGAVGNPHQEPLAVMTMQQLLLSGSDVFYALNGLQSTDRGRTWTPPVEHATFVRQTVPSDPNRPLPPGAEQDSKLVQPGDETTVCDYTPKWHPASGRLLGTGQTVWYRDNKVLHAAPRRPAYAVYDAEQQTWKPWRVLELPDEPQFGNAGAGSGQRCDLDNGDILLAIYHRDPQKSQYSVTVFRCRFDGETLVTIARGNSQTLNVKRGLYEPSLTQFGGKFFLTLRNDDAGYVAVSDDGLNFGPAQKWTFDDGELLGNYNTQQHWVTHRDSLYLVYTRRGANNDHVFRHRAPLFIGKVDPERLQVIRASEQILVPERGARLGNFGVCEYGPDEIWVTVTEWMQPQGVDKYGSDNSVWVAKLTWNSGSARSEDQQQSSAKPPLPESLSKYAHPPAEFQNDLGDFRSPLIFKDGTRVETAADWQRRRTELLQDWHNLLGAWPPLITQPEVEILESTRRENFTQHTVRFLWTPTEKTTGYLLIPDGEGPMPAVVTVFYEPETAIGLRGEYRDFAYQLAKRGFVTLSIGTTEASQAQTYALYWPSLDDAKVQPLSMLGYAAANAWYVLASRPEVDAARIGIVGHSFGGKWAMFASCLFDKFAAAAWSDPGIVFDDTRPSINYWEPWYLGYHPKPWRKRGLVTAENPSYGLYPQLRQQGRDLHELHVLMAPRPVLVSGGSEDPPARWQPLNHVRAVNELLGVTNRVFMTNRPEHSPNAESNAVIYEFFEHFLKPAPPQQ